MHEGWLCTVDCYIYRFIRIRKIYSSVYFLISQHTNLSPSPRPSRQNVGLPSLLFVLILQRMLSSVCWIIFIVMALVLLSKAPITCIRCNTIRGSGFFKCSRCGDAFKAEPVITPGWEKGMATSSKKAKNSEDEATLEKSNEIGW